MKNYDRNQLLIPEEKKSPIWDRMISMRESVLAAFKRHIRNEMEGIEVMKKLRSSAELQLLVHSFSEK